MASMDSTSVAIVSVFTSNTREHRARGVMPGNPADGATAYCARSAEKHVFVFSLYAPGADLSFTLSKRERRRVVKNISMIHPQRIFDIQRTFTFDARTAIARSGKTIFNRLLQPLVHALEELFLRFAPHILIVSREQTPGSIESEQRHRMESFLLQVRRENTV